MICVVLVTMVVAGEVEEGDSEVVEVEVDDELEVVLVDDELEVVLDVEVELVLVDVLVELCVDLLVLVSPPTVADGCPIIKYPK